MVYVLVIVLPLALLGLMLAMDRVERPIRRAAEGERLDEFLDSAWPEDMDTYVRLGLAPAMDDQQRRRRPGAADTAGGPSRPENPGGLVQTG